MGGEVVKRAFRIVARASEELLKGASLLPLPSAIRHYLFAYMCAGIYQDAKLNAGFLLTLS